MTVYSDSPLGVAKGFEAAGAEYLHVVDLEGAKDGTTPNLDVIVSIVNETSLKVEVGGGVRSDDVLKAYIDAGVYRVILGTAAVSDPEFLERSVARYGARVAVGVDLSDGMVAIKGWREISALRCEDFFERLEKLGVKTVICTDISKDGLLGGTNIELYRSLSEKFSIDIIASGGVSSLDDVKKLSEMNMYGAILGKALYAGRIELREAIELCREGAV
jgi:phosphoribosylformimino-5-aminoimidazole carboxamide ribotide isomerase